MKVRTNELTGAALDYVVAKLQGHSWRCPWILQKDGLRAWLSYEQAWGNPHPEYTQDWSEGGPIIEREGMHLSQTRSNDEVAPGVFHLNPTGWRAAIDYSVLLMSYNHSLTGPTPLVAAMRCYVASKLGDEIEIPDELNQGTP